MYFVLSFMFLNEGRDREIISGNDQYYHLNKLRHRQRRRDSLKFIFYIFLVKHLIMKKNNKLDLKNPSLCIDCPMATAENINLVCVHNNNNLC